LCALALWLLRTRFWEHRDALALGVLVGLVCGALRWWQLHRNIARRHRRYERNKIFVNYLNALEAAIAAVAFNIYIAIPLGVALIVVTLLTTLSAHWWTVLGSSFGFVTTGFLAGCIVWYERRHGLLYYQYQSETWSGAEGLLYQEGIVIQPLTPAGKVKVEGVLWNAVSLSGETIDEGERIEVISVERLTLYVDRLPTTSSGTYSDSN
ncbi:MAG: NfeD family protein, partial [Candidatus Tectomicrobia bacterium]